MNVITQRDHEKRAHFQKVEKIYEDSLDLIPSPSVKIQSFGWKVYLR